MIRKWTFNDAAGCQHTLICNFDVGFPTSKGAVLDGTLVLLANQGSTGSPYVFRSSGLEFRIQFGAGRTFLISDTKLWRCLQCNGIDYHADDATSELPPFVELPPGPRNDLLSDAQSVTTLEGLGRKTGQKVVLSLGTRTIARVAAVIVGLAILLVGAAVLYIIPDRPFLFVFIRAVLAIGLLINVVLYIFTNTNPVSKYFWRRHGRIAS